MAHRAQVRVTGANDTSDLAIIPHDGATGRVLVLEDVEEVEVGGGGAELRQLDS